MRGNWSIFVLLIFIFSCSEVEESNTISELVKQDSKKIRLSFSTDQLRTCDLLEVSIEVRYPQNLTVKMPGSVDSYGDFSPYGINLGSPVAINEKLNRLTQIIILEPGMPGTHKLPPMNFTFFDENGEKSILSSKEKTFNVKSVLPENHSGAMEEIVVFKNRVEYELIILGVLLIFSPVIYLATKKIPTLPTESEKLEEAYQGFAKLKDLQAEELLNQLPKSVAVFLKKKFSLQETSDNLHLIIPKLGLSEKHQNDLNATLRGYEEIRYSSKEQKEEQIHIVWQSFDSLLKEMRGVKS